MKIQKRTLITSAAKTIYMLETNIQVILSFKSIKLSIKLVNLVLPIVVSDAVAFVSQSLH